MSELSQTYMIGRMEEKLRQLMPKDEFSEFIEDVAKGAFLREVDESPDKGFRDFVHGNLEEIFGEDDT